MPAPGVADQLKMPLSSVPDRLTLNGALLTSTVVIGLAGALITGAAFPQLFVTDELRGLGAPIAKSAALLSVSTQPLPFRIAAVVFVRGAVAKPSKQFAPS